MNPQMQKQRMIKWFQREKSRAINSPHPQINLYARNKRINIETYTSDYIRSWIYRLNKLKKNLEMINLKDIRKFFI